MTELPILQITYRDIYSGKYVGPTDVTHWHGHIELVRNLGVVFFDSDIYAGGRILARAGSGIRSSGNIFSGWFINSNLDLLANGNIRSLQGIESRGIIHAGLDINTDANIKARGHICGRTIRFGGSLRTKSFIQYKESIECLATIVALKGISHGVTGVESTINMTAENEVRKSTKTMFQAIIVMTDNDGNVTTCPLSR